MRTRLLTLVEDNQGLLLALAIAAAYVPMLLRSFWVDEAGMYWMARGGPLAAMARTWQWPGQSVLYSGISSLFVADGGAGRDLLLRVPALGGSVLLAYFLYRFAEDAIGVGAGRIAAILAILHPVTVEFGTQARPYSFAMAAFAASCWALFRWIRDGERRWLLWWVLASALVIYFHYLFAIGFVAQAAYLGVKRRGVAGLGLASAAVCLLCLPLAPHLRLLFRESGTLPFMPPPGFGDLARLLSPPWFLVGSIASAALVWRRTLVRLPGGAWIGFVLTWWLAGPALLFLVSRNSPMRMFVPRYLAYSAPGLILLLSLLAWHFFGARRGAVWALAAGLLATGFSFRRGNGAEELGPVFSLVDRGIPLIFTSELPESNAYDWKAGNAPGSYLYAPIAAYHVPNRLIPLPNRIDESARQYVGETVLRELREVPVAMMVTRDPAWVRLVGGELAREGFAYRWSRPNSFYVVRFEKPLPAEAAAGDVQ